jgi:hypothetical protein
MFKSHAILVSAKLAALVGAAFIVLAVPTIGLAAADGGTTQTPPPARDGNGWIG